VAATIRDRRIRAAVGEGVTNRTYDDNGLTENHGLRSWLQERVVWVLFTTADPLTVADPPLALRDAVAQASPQPVLVMPPGTSLMKPPQRDESSPGHPAASNCG